MSDFFKESDCDMLSVGRAQALSPISPVVYDCISPDKANAILRERGEVVYGNNERMWKTERSLPCENNGMIIYPDRESMPPAINVASWPTYLLDRARKLTKGE